jgi:hypothetical protein
LGEKQQGLDANSRRPDYHAVFCDCSYITDEYHSLVRRETSFHCGYSTYTH